MKISLTNDKVIADYGGGRPEEDLIVHEFSSRIFSVPNANDSTQFKPYPENIRWMSQDGSKFIVERPPAKQLVRYLAGRPADGVDRGEIELFEIAVPWQLYYVDFDLKHIHIFFSNKQITSVEDIIFSPTLPNVNPGGSACSGPVRTAEMFDDRYPLGGQQFPRAMLLNKAVAGFWDNTFNDDMNFGFNQLPREIQEYPGMINAIVANPDNEETLPARRLRPGDRNWARIDNRSLLGFLESKTIENICEVEWLPTGKTFSQITVESRYGDPNPNAFIGNSTIDRWMRRTFLQGREQPRTAEGAEATNAVETPREQTPWDQAKLESDYIHQAIGATLGYIPDEVDILQIPPINWGNMVLDAADQIPEEIQNVGPWEWRIGEVEARAPMNTARPLLIGGNNFVGPPDGLLPNRPPIRTIRHDPLLDVWVDVETNVIVATAEQGIPRGNFQIQRPAVPAVPNPPTRLDEEQFNRNFVEELGLLPAELTRTQRAVIARAVRGMEATIAANGEQVPVEDIENELEEMDLAFADNDDDEYIANLIADAELNAEVQQENEQR